MASWSRAGVRQPEETLSFLASASYVLASSLDYETTLERVAQLPIPILADWCAVDVAAEDGTVQRKAVAQVDPSMAELTRALEPRRLNGNRAKLLPEATGHRGQRGNISAMSVPLIARGKVLGNLTMALAGRGRNYGAPDLELAEDLARRAGLALDNARLYGAQLEGTRRKDEFLAMLGHELRSPLAPILSALHALQLRGVEDPTQRWAIGVVQRQARHLARLVDDLVEVSRITRGKIELRKEPVELGYLMEKAASTCRPQLESRQHELVLQRPEPPIWVEADPLRLEQVLVSLLDNAAKYTEPGGRVRLSAERDKEEAVLRVQDTGMGISQEMLPRIWELFIQGSRSLDRAQGGLGIGLTLVRSLVALHGGNVQAFSAGPNQGSEMVVRLPAISKPESRSEPSAKPETDANAVGLRVLVVDDNVDSAVGLGEVLRLWGYEVRIAHDGPGALTAAHAFIPRAVLLDIGLPGMDGYEVARKMRQDEELAPALLVALTGYGQPEDQRMARDAGFDLHYTKPVDLGALRKVLTEGRRTA